MSGTVPGPDYQPPDVGGAPSYANAPGVPLPPPPRRESRDNTVRNLLIVLLVAVFTIVPATGMWVVASLKDNRAADDSAPAATVKGKSQDPAAEQPAVVQPPPEQPAATVNPTPAEPPPQQGGPGPGPGGGGHLCCCDGAPSKCTSPKKGCCQRHGGICPCQGGR